MGQKRGEGWRGIKILFYILFIIFAIYGGGVYCTVWSQIERICLLLPFSSHCVPHGPYSICVSVVPFPPFLPTPPGVEGGWNDKFNQLKCARGHITPIYPGYLQAKVDLNFHAEKLPCSENAEAVQDSFKMLYLFMNETQCCSLFLG